MQCGCTSSELSLSTPAFIISSSSSCKLQSLSSSLKSKLFLGFTSHIHPQFLNNKRNDCKRAIFLGFKPQALSKMAALPKKNTNKGKNSKYGGILLPILQGLKANSNVEITLDLYSGKLSPKEQTVILKEQGKWDKVLRVFEWFKSQKDYVPNVIHYNIVLRALGRAQKWDELRLCWVEMAKNLVMPTNNTYSMLVDVYGKAGLFKEALLWIKHMKLRGIFPDEVTMSTVIKVLKDAKEYDRADRFYKNWSIGKIVLDDLEFGDVDDLEPISFKQFLSTELFRTGGRTSSLTDSDKSDVNSSVRKPCLTTTYNTLIDLYGKAGRLKEAAEVFADMLKSGVALDAFTFNTMIFICGSHGSLTEAEALLDEMEERGISPDTKTYNIFLSLYADVGKIDDVLRCYRRIREVGLFPDVVTHRAVFQVLCERKMVQEVEAVIKEMEKLEMRIDENSFPLLTKMYVDQGSIEQAKCLVDKSLSCSRLSSKTFSAILDVYAEKGLWAEAEALFYTKRDGFEQKKEVLEYNVMIKAYGIAKLHDKAISLFKGMRNQGIWPDECTYNSLIQMFTKDDIVDKARELMAEMHEAGFKPSCTTYSAIIACYAKTNRLSDAVDMFQEMLQADVKPNEVVYGSLIDAFAEAGKFDEAIQYFHAMEDSGILPNQIILTSMIKAYGKIGSVEGAHQLYEKMKKFDGGPDIIASNSILNLYAELGMVSEAKVIYDYLRDKDLADGVTFATMMYAYKNMGMFDEAIEVAEEIKKSNLMTDSVSFNKVIACYSANNQLVECGELLHEMLVDQKLLPDVGTFRVLFTVLKKADFPSEAVKKLEKSYREGRPFAKQAVITSVFSIVGLHKYALESCGAFRKEDAAFNSFAYNAAIRAHAAYGKIDEALRIYMKMQDEGLEPDVVTLTILVNCYGKAGMIEGVKRIYSKLKFGEIEPSEALYKAIIDAYKTANRHDLAELVNQEMRFALDAQEYTDSESEDWTGEISDSS